MGITLVIATAVAASAVYLVLARHAGPVAITTTGHPTSPLDEAERILARRYAKAEITAEEYSRMLSILRR